MAYFAGEYGIRPWEWEHLDAYEARLLMDAADQHLADVKKQEAKARKGR